MFPPCCYCCCCCCWWWWCWSSIFLVVFLQHVCSLEYETSSSSSSSSDDSSSSSSLLGPFPRVQIVGYTLGDSQRSSSSSNSFFDSMDTDRDGTVRPSELAAFLKLNIGGSTLDEDSEIDREVETVMSKLDQDHDNSLQSYDVFEYWNHQLESLLTVEEVAEWVVYSCQLPYEIGHVFRNNHVTGYDFAELVENEGESLFTELNIDKPSFRRRIVRLARARMLGIGSLPEAPHPQDLIVQVEHCSAISFLWKKCVAEGFPVHSYRIQRRILGGEYADNNDSCSIETPHGSVISTTSTTPVVDWMTVYVGGDTQFVDTRVEKGKEYTYRIQAWSPIGRSEWTTIPISDTWKKQKCHHPSSSSSSSKMNMKKNNCIQSVSPQNVPIMMDMISPPPPPTTVTTTTTTMVTQSFLSWIYKLIHGFAWIFSLIVTFSRAFLTITAVFAALMKFRRMNLHTTTSSGKPIFPWLSRWINQLSSKYFGTIIFPHYVTGDEKLKKKASALYDRQVNAVGLFGYKQSLIQEEKNKNISSYPSMEQPTNVMMGGLSSTSFPAANSTSSILKIYKQPSTQSLSLEVDTSRDTGPTLKPLTADKTTTTSTAAATTATTTTQTTDEPENNVNLSTNIPSTIHYRKLFSRRRNLLSFSKERNNQPSIQGNSHLDIMKQESAIIYNHEEDRESSCYSVQSPDSSQSLRDDFERCNTCQKLYRFPKRCRHHCARCAATFCHKHGKTTHSNLISCKVPGNCVCLQCLQKESSKTLLSFT